MSEAKLESSGCSSVVLTVQADRLAIGERIEVGDWWHYREIGQFFMVEEPRRNWLGLREKVTRHHAPHYRISRVLKTNVRVKGGGDE